MVQKQIGPSYGLEMASHLLDLQVDEKNFSIFLTAIKRRNLNSKIQVYLPISHKLWDAQDQNHCYGFMKDYDF